jgi:nanoRNase/pAp phosphatase (c-di-AMP/oligoRNAs hydrolase)
MTYFRKLESKAAELLSLCKKNERWLILLNADPDAMASAMALKRILARRVQGVGLAMVNELSRPDNLAMVRYLQIPVQRLTPPLAAQFDRFALVDSQPHHHPEFAPFQFSIVIDHHPVKPEFPIQAEFVEVQPNYGSNSTLLTEFLYNLNLRPGKHLATALLYGIKTDTHSFEQHFHDADIKAFRYLSKYADHSILRKIVRSEFRVEWLKYFSQAFRKVRLWGDGLTVYMGEVDSTDILVILADFFLRIHDISWDIVTGISDNTLVAIFRGDGVKGDMGVLATRLFGSVGSAGGHKSMARAQIPLENLGQEHPQQFIWERLQQCKIISKTKNPKPADEDLELKEEELIVSDRHSPEGG